MALTNPRSTPERGMAVRAPFPCAVKGSVKCIQGGMAALAGGYVAPGAATTGAPGVGRFHRTADNTAGSDGAITAEVETGTFKWLNSASTDLIAQADVGSPCYIVDDQTVAKTDGGGARSVAGTIAGVDSDGVWVEMRFPVSVVAAGTSGAAMQRQSLTVNFSDLTDAVNGEAQSINVGAALPTNAVIFAHEVVLTTQFTGGGATSAKLDLGVSGDLVSIINKFDVFGSTAGGRRYAPGYGHFTSHGDRVVGTYSAAQLLATFTPDASHALSGLTAGALTINVWYAEMP